MVKHTLKNMPKYTRWDQLPILLDAPLVAVLLSVSDSTVKRLAANGELPGARKIAEQWRFDRDSLRAYITGAAVPVPTRQEF